MISGRGFGFSAAADATSVGSQRTTQPYVTGTSVLGCKYKDGVMIMADTLGSYGSLAMFKHAERIRKINEFTIFGAGGEYSDVQAIDKQLQALNVNDFVNDDGVVLSPSEYWTYLHRWLYNRRSKVNPLWNQIIVAGMDKGKSFLGAVDLYGSHWQDNIIATGYGQHLGLPILRNEWRPDMSADEARSLLEKAMTVLLYRDCRTLNSIQWATVSTGGVQISEPYTLPTYWEYKRFIDPNQTARKENNQNAQPFPSVHSFGPFVHCHRIICRQWQFPSHRIAFALMPRPMNGDDNCPF